MGQESRARTPTIPLLPNAKPSTPKTPGKTPSVLPNIPSNVINANSMGVAPTTYPNLDPRSFPKPMQLTSFGQPLLSVTTSGPQGGTQTSTITPQKPASAKTLTDSRGKNLRALVEKAINEHKIFTCVGVYPAVKNALKRRGWIEKNAPLMMARTYGTTPQRPDEETDLQWVSRNLKDYPSDFIWVIRRDNIDWRNLHKDQLINRYPRAYFTTKVGLAACLQQMHWFSEAGVSETFFPRCYRICLDDERMAFQEDFRITACMGFLRFFMESYESKGPGSIMDPQSRITPLSLDFASRQLGNYVRMRRHEDIDWLLPPNFMSQHWDAFIHQYYMVVHDKKKIRFDSTESVAIKYDLAKRTMQRMAAYWPQGHLDGVYNMWICKPGARSRGKGIVIMNSLEKILDLLKAGNAREANWVVQKYIERPLLIYKTKSDIRQWFLITDWAPLTLWFYKDSYIRFSTKPFNLEDFHESIHLTNNAVQVNYRNADGRDPQLPNENMWDNHTFQSYLRSIGKPDEWDKIYKGMQKAIIGVLLASQETTEPRKSCFELYGADFMLAEDLTPWLIEINSCPCMAGTTSVTARLCAACLEDTVKVVVDRRTNRNCDTGRFELIYKQPLSAVTIQQFTGHDLIIQGKKLSRDIDWPSVLTKQSPSLKRTNAVNPSPSALVNRLRVTRRLPTNYIVPGAIHTGTLATQNVDQNFNELLRSIRMKSKFALEGLLTQTQQKTLETLTFDDKTQEDKLLTGSLLSRLREIHRREREEQEKSGVKPGLNYNRPTTTPVKRNALETGSK